jgi:hypothetical protein
MYTPSASVDSRQTHTYIRRQTLLVTLSQVPIFALNEPICLSFIYFNLVFAAGCLLGPLRVLLLEPKVGARKAELLELLLMTRIIWQCAQFVGRRKALQNQTEQIKPSHSQRLGTGSGWIDGTSLAGCG